MRQSAMPTGLRLQAEAQEAEQFRIQSPQTKVLPEQEHCLLRGKLLLSINQSRAEPELLIFDGSVSIDGIFESPRNLASRTLA